MPREEEEVLPPEVGSPDRRIGPVTPEVYQQERVTERDQNISHEEGVTIYLNSAHKLFSHCFPLPFFPCVAFKPKGSAVLRRNGAMRSVKHEQLDP